MDSHPSIMIFRDGHQYGPYTVAQVKTYLASGEMLPSDLAWAGDGDKWVPISQLPDMQEPVEQPPAVAPAVAIPPAPMWTSDRQGGRERSTPMLLLLGFGWSISLMIFFWVLIGFLGGLLLGFLAPEMVHTHSHRVIGGLTLLSTVIGISLAIWLTVIGRLPGTRR